MNLNELITFCKMSIQTVSGSTSSEKLERNEGGYWRNFFFSRYNWLVICHFSLTIPSTFGNWRGQIPKSLMWHHHYKLCPLCLSCQKHDINMLPDRGLARDQSIFEEGGILVSAFFCMKIKTQNMIWYFIHPKNKTQLQR